MEATRSSETPVLVYQSTRHISELFILIAVTTVKPSCLICLRGILLTRQDKTTNKAPMSVCIRTRSFQFFVQRLPVLTQTDSAVYKTLH